MEVYFSENANVLYNIKPSKLNNYLYSKFGDFSDKLCYGIHNLIDTDKWYIGSTVNGIYQRFWRCFDTAHFRCVKENYHFFLTEDILENFEVVILYYDETNSIPKNDLRLIETDFIIRYDSYNKGYNRTPSAQAGFYGKNHTDDEIERIKSSLSETNKLPEVKARRSEGSKRSWKSPEYREKLTGIKSYYTCIGRKVIIIKPEKVEEMKKIYPDLKPGKPTMCNEYKKDHSYEWWNDRRWNDNIK